MSRKISLCMIVGNVEEYIERCLNSFKPIADEICVVRAIGNQAPDRTLEICEKQFGARVAEYKNAPEYEGWPHVDNFAAARQQSFDMATGDYCFWCDSDDILKTGVDKIRRHADNGGFACFIFPYDVFGKNVVVPRERMMLKDAGKWEYPVHECFKFKVEPVTAAMDDGVIVQHLPHLTKSGSNQRNLTILESIPKEKLTCGLRYHLFGELMGAGRNQEGIETAIALLAEKDLGKDERYDLLLSLVIQTPDLNQRIDLLHEAHKVDPTRREALGVLACTMMDMNRPASCLAYARQMASVLKPDVQSWNSRQPFYGYVGDDIYQQALRVNNRHEEAEKIRRHGLSLAGGPMIALLHATRGRPEMASKCRKAWHDLASQPDRIEHIFIIDEDDKQSIPLARFHHVSIKPGGGCVAAWNAGAMVTEAPVVIQLSDDWTPIPQWDDIILERIGDVNEPKVLAISDGYRQDNLLCMAICTRNYLLLDNFLFHPWFKGVYSDNWFTEVAYSRNAVIEARDVVFTHNHPAFTGTEIDETYANQNAPERYREGQEIYRQLREQNDWSSVPGFFNYWNFYKDVAAKLKDGDKVAEIGVWLGRSIIYLAQELQRLGKTNCRLIAVDHFKGESNQKEHEATVKMAGGNLRSKFEENIERCGVKDMISIYEGDSVTEASGIPNGSLAFVYIDAAHEYDPVVADLKAWLPKVKPGGIFAGHDYNYAPVANAVNDVLGPVLVHGNVWERP